MWLMGGEVALMHPTRYADLSDDSHAELRRGYRNALLCPFTCSVLGESA